MANKAYDCNTCDRSFEFKSQLQHHKLLHSPNSNYLCEKCGKTYKRASALRSHQKNFHKMSFEPKVSPDLKCLHCGKSFSNECNLVRHLAKLNSKHVCYICDRPFDRKSRLDYHIKTAKHSTRITFTNSEDISSDTVSTDTSPEFKTSTPYRLSDHPSPIYNKRTSSEDTLHGSAVTSDLVPESPSVRAGESSENLALPSNRSNVSPAIYEKRKSSRVPLTKLIETAIGDEEFTPNYLNVMEVLYPGVGSGIETFSDIVPNTFVCVYHGEKISEDVGIAREWLYSESGAKHDYIFYFRNQCIDATNSIGSIGRLINHSRLSPNCIAKLYNHHGNYHIIIMTNCHITAGSQLLFDYGERRPELIKKYPWLDES